MKKWRRNTIIALGTLLGLYVLGLVPAPAAKVQTRGTGTVFEWNQDPLWDRLEAAYRQTRRSGCEAAAGDMEVALASLDESLSRLNGDRLPLTHSLFESIEDHVLRTAPLVAACPSRLRRFEESAQGIRRGVKKQSIHWNMNDAAVKQRLYRLMYSTREAFEEVVLQQSEGETDLYVHPAAILPGVPSAKVHGVTVQSGDLLLSRGGAPTSALISRGNDFPGNFSHVALAHVDGQTKAVSLVEAHIEKGVAVASVDEYLKDKKLRILVLRLRPNLPALRVHPALPHAAATAALERSRNEHIPYDFSMDFDDHGALFCSEVASAAYGDQGIALWMQLSHMSSPVLETWLADFGVRHFITQAPSDLEYDPQLQLVAEWRNPETLRQDHLDSAVIDAMLTRASPGERLPYNRFLLPVTRAMKLYSVVRNQMGAPGPVPEGMSAAAALRNVAFSTRHAQLRDAVRARINAFEQENGYYPPYWQQVQMAEDAIDTGL